MKSRPESASIAMVSSYNDPAVPTTVFPDFNRSLTGFMRKNLQLPLRLLSLTSEDKAGAAPPPGMVARSPTLRPHLMHGGAQRHMRLQEAAHPGDRALLQLRGFLPRVHRDLGVRRQRGDIDRGLQRMRRDVIRQHQHRRVAGPDEVARYAVQN